jgi:lysophospholipase L1-like esterase
MAGIGAGAYAVQDSCRRSARSFAADASRRSQAVLTDESCPGAKVPQVLAQIARIPRESRTVLVQVGGNDLGFSDLALSCLMRFGSPCLPAVARARDQLPALVSGLDAVARAVRDQAPQARLVMVGYPRLLGRPSTCANFLVGRLLSKEEISAINLLQSRLDATIRSAAAKAGAEYVDWPRVVDRHSLCSADRWFITPLSGAAEDSLHPTATAYAAMGRQVAGILRR